MSDAARPSFSPSWPADIVWVQSRLEPGEHLLWVGRPLTVWPFWRIVPFLLVGMTFASAGGFYLWTLLMPPVWPAWHQFYPWTLTGALAVGSFLGLAPGLGMLLGPLYEYRSGIWSAFAVTDRRILIRQPRFLGGTWVSSYCWDRVLKVRRYSRRDEAGDLYFDVAVRSWVGRERTGIVVFHEIPHPPTVEALVRATLLATQDR